LNGSLLEGAYLSHSWAHGASLDDAELQGAILDGAKLLGASLVGAQLQAASLDSAKLQGASLEGAQLRGATFFGALLQGASLNDAQLEGASLDYAELQGATLDEAEFFGASFQNVSVWRADARKADFMTTRVAGVKTGSTQSCEVDSRLDTCGWDEASYLKLRNLVMREVPDGDLHRRALERIDATLDPTKPFPAEDEIARVWIEEEHASPDLEDYEATLAEIWRELGCSTTGAPYVARSCIRRMTLVSFPSFAPNSPEVPKLAAAFLDDKCLGTRGLSETEITALKNVRTHGHEAPILVSRPRPKARPATP
jgi:hypothetical protein